MSPLADSSFPTWAQYPSGLEPPRTGPSEVAVPRAEAEICALVLQACGNFVGKHVLDFGFRNGELARILDLLGGSVDAVDSEHSRIPQLREEHPAVYWFATELTTWQLGSNGIPYDLIVTGNVLGARDFDQVVGNLLAALTPTGRLVITVANSDYPIARQAPKADPNQEEGISEGSLPTRLRQHAGQFCFSYRGIHVDPSLPVGTFVGDAWRPLDLSDNHRGCFDQTSPPYRLQVVGTRTTPDPN